MKLFVEYTPKITSVENFKINVIKLLKNITSEYVTGLEFSIK